MDSQWVTWALQGLIVGVLLWFKQQLDKNTDAVNELGRELPEKYLQKDDFETYRKETRETLHDLRGAVPVKAAQR